MKISSLKPGDKVWSVRKYRMGNTTIQTTGVYSVVVKEVHDTYVIASWNGNPEQRFYAGQVANWKKEQPVLVKTAVGAYRLATRAEKEALKSS
ncbi:hypothetical protein [Leminorella grimontii]|uniref:hypothetical protein n=1 Tax=Leminorella grimontii TaxID=82981 RepID=UPI0020843AD8|nr:hypothetical protein [Leminorella grimontii]GKX60183.1 hypothetical protein SOASR031_24980 [Leminorella grimontii]